MNDNRTIQLMEIPIGGKDGFIWNRLHSEREDTCETLPRLSGANCGVYRELLQARLRLIDQALDRLMAGSYGTCAQCGQSISEARLDIDPATSLCLDCSAISSDTSETSPSAGVVLENLNPFDTILLRTHNSDYRILLLDPKTGRSLVEGGSYLLEPREAFVKGSTVPGSTFNGGTITLGGRLEMWVDEKVFITSPVKSIEVKENAAAESIENITAALR